MPREMGGGRRSSSCSSSGEEDGDADWKSAIDSVAQSSFYPNSSVAASGDPLKKPHDCSKPSAEEDGQPPRFNHFQKKVQRYLYDTLEKSLETVRDPMHFSDDNPVDNGGKIRLFKHSPLGIVFDHADQYQRPDKKPKIIPGEELDEKSKKFRRRLESIAVDGADIIAAANDARQKSLARIEAKEAAAKAAAKREEERVVELKRIRGERWPPSIAKLMRRSSQSCK